MCCHYFVVSFKIKNKTRTLTSKSKREKYKKRNQLYFKFKAPSSFTISTSVCLYCQLTLQTEFPGSSSLDLV